jgi:putative ABC transport system permease protein
MRWVTRAGLRLRAILRRGAVEAELDEELRYHIEREVEERVSAGEDPVQARRETALRFGAVDRYKEECREARGVRVLDELRQDVRYGARTLRRSPSFSLVVMILLALGIGLSGALFAAVYEVLLKPLPYRHADDVLVLWQTRRDDAVLRDEFSPANFLDLREWASTFDGIAAAEEYGLDYVGADGPETLMVWRVSEQFFSVLGVEALLGRTFEAAEYEPGRAQVLVLGHQYWQRRFGGDAGVIGRVLELDGEPFEVVGIMPPRFRFPTERAGWVPRVMTEQDRQLRASTYLHVIARPAAIVSAAVALRELESIGARLAAEHPRINAGVTIDAVPLREQIVGNVRPTLLILMSAVVVLLLIACTNVASLFLTRTARREREFGLRSALGARGGRLARQLLTEGALLAAGGCLLGVVVARQGVRAIRALGAADVPQLQELALEPRALAFMVIVSTVTVLAFAALPAWRIARADPRRRLHSSGTRTTVHRRRLGSGLVIAEVALSFVLVAAAGLLVRSYVTLTRVEPGFRSDHVLATSLYVYGRYDSPADQVAFVREAGERIGSLPGVRSVGVSTSLPLHDRLGREDADVVPEGRVYGPGEEPVVRGASVTAGYFETLRIPLQRGRVFTDADDARGPPVAVISESLARRFFPDEGALGRRITVSFPRGPVTREIVGVVGDVRHAGLDETPRPTVYVPFLQGPSGALVFTVRTDHDPDGLARAVAERIWTLAPTLPLYSTVTLDGLRNASLRVRRFSLLLLGMFAGTALALAALGVYGLLNGVTIEQVREIGVRLALGASRVNVLARVLRHGTALALAGLAIGGATALAATQLLRSLLFGVTPLDPWTFLVGGAVILATALLAAFVPAWRAARVDPATTLRAE